MKNVFLYLYISIFIFSCGESGDHTEKFKDANSLLKNGEYESSIELYKSILGDSVIDKRIYNNLGAAYLRSGEPDSALFYLEKAIQLDENYYDARLNKVQALLAMRDFRGVVNESSQMEINYPDSTVLKLMTGMGSMQIGDFEKAKEKFLIVLDRQPENIDAKINLATIYLFSGETDEARDLTLSVISQDATRHEAFNLFGMILLANKDYNASLDAFDRAIELKENANYYNNKAQAYLAMGEADQAKRMLEKSKSIDSDNYYLWRNFAWYHSIKNTDSVGYFLNKARNMDDSEYLIIEEDSIFDRLSSTH
ncbi:tetratricopeptide repeat protein [Mangrovivirga sp. M17]|uniref:Tetratricopeptide repeat protein n=1 Tax=Mangrovivirga halotolerans TaxID=2993936 RepID=A0ABT3RLA1_9BACT|nr:tetratricopeptide repeat protein [Mangrovivirga halotolerans]MCX2742392.1 tetratricopeptide repeat protein [Mangrovivirga halotolerans]